MLQYRQNINYQLNKKENIDNLIKDLKELVKLNADAFQIYQLIKKQVYKELVLQELAITTIAPDLITIHKKNLGRRLIVVLTLLAYPYSSYTQIGELCGGIRKQTVHAILQKMAKEYYWLENLLKLKNDR